MNRFALARRQVVDCINGSSVARTLQGGMAGGLLPVHGSVCRAAESGEEFDGSIDAHFVCYAQIMHGTKQTHKSRCAVCSLLDRFASFACEVEKHFLQPYS